MDQRFSPGDLFKSDKQPQAPPPPQPPAPQPDNSAQPGIVYPDNQGQPQSAYPAAYDFIVNSPQPSGGPNYGYRGGGSSTGKRALVVGAGLVFLFIAFMVLKNLVLAGPDLSAFFGVAQDQQVLLQLTDNTVATRAGFSDSTLNFIATASPSLKASQRKILKYMTSGGTKIKPAEIGLRINPQDIKSLDAAVANSTLDSTYKTLMQTKLQKYMKDLKLVYGQTTGKNGRTLLNDDYAQAELLLKQLGQ